MNIEYKIKKKKEELLAFQQKFFEKRIKGLSPNSLDKLCVIAEFLHFQEKSYSGLSRVTSKEKKSEYK